MTLALPVATYAPDRILRRVFANRRVVIGGVFLLAIVALCVGSLPWTMRDRTRFYFDYQDDMLPEIPPTMSAHEDPQDQTSPLIESRAYIFGTDKLGRSIFARCLIGGTISLSVGIAAALISVILGVSIGMIAGYRGGWIDALLMRTVDVMYGLPYILLVILFKIAFERKLERLL